MTRYTTLQSNEITTHFLKVQWRSSKWADSKCSSKIVLKSRYIYSDCTVIQSLSYVAHLTHAKPKTTHLFFNLCMQLLFGHRSARKAHKNVPLKSNIVAYRLYQLTAYKWNFWLNYFSLNIYNMYKVHANDIYHRQCKYGVHVCQSVLECWIGEFEKLSLIYLCLKLVNSGSVRLAHGSKKFFTE